MHDLKNGPPCLSRHRIPIAQLEITISPHYIVFSDFSPIRWMIRISVRYQANRFILAISTFVHIKYIQILIRSPNNSIWCSSGRQSIFPFMSSLVEPQSMGHSCRLIFYEPHNFCWNLGKDLNRILGPDMTRRRLIT